MSFTLDFTLLYRLLLSLRSLNKALCLLRIRVRLTLLVTILILILKEGIQLLCLGSLGLLS